MVTRQMPGNDPPRWLFEFLLPIITKTLKDCSKVSYQRHLSATKAFDSYSSHVLVFVSTENSTSKTFCSKHPSSQIHQVNACFTAFHYTSAVFTRFRFLETFSDSTPLSTLLTEACNNIIALQTRSLPQPPRSCLILNTQPLQSFRSKFAVFLSILRESLSLSVHPNFNTPFSIAIHYTHTFFPSPLKCTPSHPLSL